MINKQWIAWYLHFVYFAPGGLGVPGVPGVPWCTFCHPTCIWHLVVLEDRGLFRLLEGEVTCCLLPCLPLPGVFLYVICHLYVFLNLLNLNIGDTSLNDKFLTTTCHASYICFHVISHQVVSSPSCLLLPSDLILPVPSPPSPIIQQTFRKIRNFLTNAWGQSQVGDID